MKILSMIFVAVVSFSYAQEAKTEKEPVELTQLREQWQRARTQAIEPIDKKYVQMLEEQKLRFTKAGKLEEAVAVDGELKALTVQQSTSTQSNGNSQKTNSNESVKADLAEDIQRSVWVGKSNRVTGMKLLFFPNGATRLYHAPAEYPNAGFWTSWAYKIVGEDLNIATGAGKQELNVNIDKKRSTFHVPNWGDFERSEKEQLPSLKN